MQITISTRHGSLSPETQDRIRGKVEKLRRFYDRVAAIDVKVDLERQDSPRVELRVSVERSDTFVANETASNVAAALDGVLDKLEQQLRKHKDRRRDRRSQPLGRVETGERPEEGQH